MRKILILSAITLFTGVANAGDLDLSNLSVSLGASNSKTAMGKWQMLKNLFKVIHIVLTKITKLGKLIKLK